MDKNDSRTRKWQITINNPIEKGYSHENIKNIINSLKNVEYWCMCDEIGEEKTPHTHIYIKFRTARSFSSMLNNFKGGHFEMAKGTSKENRDYITKGGKWEKDKKHETNIKETFEESGECPAERQGCRNDLEDLYCFIKEGLTNSQILEIDANNIMRLDKIDKARLTYLSGIYKSTRRLNIEVTYIYGRTGSGKTRGIMDKYGDENVYRVTDYEHPFDNYECQDIVVFEEFRNSLKIQDMLNYLDVYPLVLPCRYNNRVACYTKVFIISNWTLEQQYEPVQKDYSETWQAFLRRIHNIKVYDKETTVYTRHEYFNRFEPINEETKKELKQIYKQEVLNV